MNMLWHDYETSGLSADIDRPIQFAAIRTDNNFQELESCNWLCQPATDRLPSIDALLITRTNILDLQKLGLQEKEFAARIYEMMHKQRDTTIVGYNNTHFDDEFTRYLFYRNFYDIYGHEYQNGNDRWDIINLVRLMYVARQDILNWIPRKDGAPSFKLEHVAQANSLNTDQAHDALFDVQATIHMAQLIQEKEQKLFNHCFNLRHRDYVGKYLNVDRPKPLLYINKFISSYSGGASIILPIRAHPEQKNAIICVDLTIDNPKPFIIRLNQTPIVAPIQVISKDRWQELGVDVSQALENIEQRKDLELEAYHPTEEHELDAESLLYQDFISSSDKNLCRQITQVDYSGYSVGFKDDRLAQLLQDYRWKYFPKQLSQLEQDEVLERKAKRLLTKDDYMQEIDGRMQDNDIKITDTAILQALKTWTSSL